MDDITKLIDFVHSREYYLLKNYRWLILKNHDDIHFYRQYGNRPREVRKKLCRVK